MSDAPRWLERLAEGTLDEVEVAEAAPLTLPSGVVVACDPLVFLRSAEPFARKVKPGTYPVRVATLAGDFAYAMLVLGDAPVARWEVARCPGEDDVEGWPGYGVDSGTGCFVDLQTVEKYVASNDALREKVRASMEADGIELGDDWDAYHQTRDERLEAAGGDPLHELEPQIAARGWGEATLSKRPKGNLVVFRTGGDGVFASFWGLDAEGAPQRLVTDFGVLEPDDPDFDDEEDEDFDDLLDDSPLSEADLAGLEALAAALGRPAEPEEEQGPSPLFLQTRDLLKRWVDEEKVELEEDVSLDVFAEALLEKLVSLAGHRHPGAHVGEWLLERPEVADVYASDDEIEADLKPKK